MSKLTGDDGTPLEVKEAEVLDQHGRSVYALNPFEDYAGATAGPTLRVIKGGWLLTLVISILLPIFLFAGFFVFAAIAVVLTVVWWIRSLFRSGVR